MLRFTCPHCKKAYQVQDNAAGKTATCAKCGKKIQVPSSNKQPSPEPADPLGADSDIYGLASEPITRQNDRWDTSPVSSGMNSTPRPTYRSSHRSEYERPSRFPMVVGGIMFIGIAVVAILWFNGQLNIAIPGLPGSSQAARNHLTSEIDKWMRGEDRYSKIAKGIVPYGFMDSKPPISYEIKSIFPAKPNFLHRSEIKIRDPKCEMQREQFDSSPHFCINVVFQFQSQADTPLEQVISYTYIWHSGERKWFIFNR